MANQHGDGSGSGDRTILKPRPGCGPRRSRRPSAAPRLPVRRRRPSCRARPRHARPVRGAATSAESRVAGSDDRSRRSRRSQSARRGGAPRARLGWSAASRALTGRIRRRCGSSSWPRFAASRNARKAAGVAATRSLAARYALCADARRSGAQHAVGRAERVGAATAAGRSFIARPGAGRSSSRCSIGPAPIRARYPDLLELQYTCVALGFTGKYADRSRARAARPICSTSSSADPQPRGAPPPALSLRWRGVRDRRNPLLRYVPLWVVAAAAVALLAGGYLYFRIQLGRSAEPMSTALSQVGMQDLTAPAPRSPPPGDTEAAARRSRTAGRRSAVEEQGARSVVTLSGGDLFAPGQRHDQPAFDANLDRIGRGASKRCRDRVLVVGHSDSQPIRSLRFRTTSSCPRERALAVLHRL